MTAKRYVVLTRSNRGEAVVILENGTRGRCEDMVEWMQSEARDNGCTDHDYPILDLATFLRDGAEQTLSGWEQHVGYCSWYTLEYQRWAQEERRKECERILWDSMQQR